MKNLVLCGYTIVLLLVISSSIYSQSNLYISTNIKKAYEAGTRSMDGKPGKNYWINSSDYKIKVKIDPQTRLLNGSEHITYFNNSPDTLKEIVLRLYQNINKIGAPRYSELNKSAITDGIVIDNIKINNKNFNLDSSSVYEVTLQILKLKNYLNPNSEINFDFDWHFTIPEGSNIRMGTYDSTTFLIAYWYPQIAVYDDIDGWDKYPYNGLYEFYNDFNNYDVQISVPNSFAVWSTGELQNAESIFTEKYLNRYNEAHNSDEIIHIIDSNDVKAGSIFNSANSTNTWHYKAEHVPDFCFSLSDHYLWDATSLIVDEKTKRRVYIAAAYKKESKDFFDVDKIARDAISYLSTELPGVPFPYPSLTVFNGGGGMEYPMMVNDGSASSFGGAAQVTSHEITHQYFPFYMGVNEKKYAWMDEGMAVFLPLGYQESADPNYDPRGRRFINYEKKMGSETEMPMMIPTVLLGVYLDYRNASYNRSAYAYVTLEDYLGKEKFKKALHLFMQRWNGKHPMPYDFFFTFNQSSGEDLKWFWNPWFFNRGVVDLGIKSANYSNGNLKIVIENLGQIPATAVINIITVKDTISTIVTAGVWKTNDHEYILNKKVESQVLKILLGNEDYSDVNRKNNEFILTNSHSSD